ncbi:amidohydrolase family protein [Alcaligenaceae bacterium]|nr:amidohydrolase family protein [Alcaligenaceae bacterium]
MSEPGILDCELPGPASRPTNAAPRGCTDTHFHIFGQRDRYPLAPGRLYNPGHSPVPEYRKMARTVGIDRTVIVQASVYGTDNSCLTDAIAEFGIRDCRGIAVIDPGIRPDQLRLLHDQGVRGIRFNAITSSTPLEWLPEIAAMIAPLGWHVQLWIKADRLLEIARMVESLPVDIVLDHMAQMPVGASFDDPLVRNVLRLMETGRCWMKLVGYRISAEPPPYRDVDRLARAVIGVAPGRCLWGTDWPHIYLEGRPMPDAGVLFDGLYRWCDADTARAILVDNPASLYGFEN